VPTIPAHFIVCILQWMDTKYAQKEGHVMYQLYDELSMRILSEAINAGKGKSSVSTTRTSIRKFRKYMEDNCLQYAPEIAAKWLDEKICPISSHETYKQIRLVHYRIAILFNPEKNLRELFYKDIQSDFDRLPFWAQDAVSGFLAHYKAKQKCIAGLGLRQGQALSCIARFYMVWIRYSASHMRGVQTIT